MKPREVRKKLRQAGWTFKEGANHTLAISPDGKNTVPIPRHESKDINYKTLKAIQAQTGVHMA